MHRTSEGDAVAADMTKSTLVRTEPLDIANSGMGAFLGRSRLGRMLIVPWRGLPVVKDLGTGSS